MRYQEICSGRPKIAILPVCVACHLECAAQFYTRGLLLNPPNSKEQSSRITISPMNKRASSRRAILSGMILPAALVTSASGADIILDGSQNTYNLNTSPVFGEGLREGYTNLSDDETTAIGSAILG